MTGAWPEPDNPGGMRDRGDGRRRDVPAAAGGDSLLRAALEAAPDGIIVVAADGRVVLYNAAFLRLWGLDAAVMELERPALRRAAAARLVRDPEAFLAEAEEVQANPYAVMHRLVELVDGRVLEMHSRPLELSEREAGRIWHYRDVTELVRTRQKLEAATRLAEAQFEGAPYGIIVIALDGRFLRANRRFFAMTGLDATWAELPPPERAACLEALAKEPERARAFNARWREQPGTSFSELFERCDGAWFKVSTQPLRAGGGEVLGQVFFYEDVTAQVAAEQALAESEARLRTMINEMETGITVENRQGVITHANPAATRLLGLPADQVVGRAVDWSWGAVREDGSPFPPSEMPVNFAMTTGAAVRGVVMGLPLGGGQLRWLLVSAAVLRRGPAGEPQEVVATFTDYTDQKEREGLLAKARFLESFAALSAGVAHRLNNDLTAMLGNAWLMRQEGPLTPGQEEAVAAIEAVARDAAYLVADLRAAATGSDEAKGPVELDVCLGRALIQFPEAERQRTAVVLSAGVPRVLGRPRALETAFQHVLANAFEATRGPVEVRVTRLRVAGDFPLRSPGRWEPGRIPPGEYAAVFVEDAGEGIAEEHLGRIFEPFYSTRFAGRGLGLPATAGIVREHGGYIGVHSAPGRGTTVVLAFPVPAERPEGT